MLIPAATRSDHACPNLADAASLVWCAAVVCLALFLGLEATLRMGRIATWAAPVAADPPVVPPLRPSPSVPATADACRLLPVGGTPPRPPEAAVRSGSAVSTSMPPAELRLRRDTAIAPPPPPPPAVPVVVLGLLPAVTDAAELLLREFSPFPALSVPARASERTAAAMSSLSAEAATLAASSALTDAVRDGLLLPRRQAPALGVTR